MTAQHTAQDPAPAILPPRQVYRRLLNYARPHGRVLAAGGVAMAIFAGTGASIAPLLKYLVDRALGEHDTSVIHWMPPAIFVLFMVRGLASFASAYWISWVGQAVVARMRNEVFQHLLDVPVAHHDRTRAADLQAKLTYHASQIADSASSVITSMIQGGLTAVGLLGSMFYMNWRLSLFALLLAPLVSVSVQWVNRRFRKISGRIQSSVAGITHAADEAISGRRVLKLYGGQDTAQRQFVAISDNLRQQSLKMTAANAASLASLEMIAAVGVAALVYFATLPSMLSSLTPGGFLAFVASMLLLREPLSNMTSLSERLQRGIVAGGDLFAFLDTPIEHDTGTRDPGRVSGALTIEHLRFAYRAGTRPALDDVNLQLPAGRTVAFVGRSGGGKSTLLSMIPRFYDPDAGRILLDGIDLRDYSLAALRRQIALVDQNIVLFNQTIAENIAYGHPGATRAQIEEAARRAYAWDFIQQQPQGLDTPIGQDGLQLSGGQRQRITIARALLKDAPILILDEATSALDTESEHYIQQALADLARGRTTLVIAHRLSTIQRADLIVVMQEGRPVEQGTHAELLARGGAYAALHRMQFREEPLAEAGAVDGLVPPPGLGNAAPVGVR